MATDNANASGIVTEFSHEAKLKLEIIKSLLEPCDRHKLSLLSKCPNCGARFKVPGLWMDGWCSRCFLDFGEMVKWQKLIV